MARYSLRGLVSRDATELSEPLVAAAAIESVAENTTDSFIAPWIAFALLGLPGAFAYRAVNTLDSMIGYRGKYEYLGKASARIDDVLNLIPARIATGLLLLAGLVTAGCSARQGWRTVLREHRLTASPKRGLDYCGGCRAARCGAGEVGALLHRQRIRRAGRVGHWEGGTADVCRGGTGRGCGCGSDCGTRAVGILN